ncbi:UDP-N-acetylglucosamine 1-carboxyvinyltransferase [Lactobacillus acetotolerans]|jgi:UDP-N-acetylglucosamine 1-carboxyvinyltransferase|uniref:UDP-N-acetylglucosamine 1-carboxyvinyltransferase n=1 Tax=Lactobacillus acetotolerans TaxID=1600 RepID=A0A353UBG6_9LACO|nr:UDP-N-acetylglucosamine 1-carboxyvinyltransferase [Lactobacillus acetotolerans]KRN40286.1 UDP-N-acetylglucosamine 1-carboxyvinyltransferase [Lactobacillus acetotolerans DSM 20749 = JCM 3825]QFG50800.1 UDP-N-acetylglucosamine 1-carboxyvinyltransferase [Lactobacillus acetotolerans]GGV14849.1 UDP-N-acetylglucosamine 1-carboxyvinyltransferase [Lactobacillus acetotolerans DSM 20749 = JCM 3825]HBG91352.1 UDP-N-acetylglucosamine 1-carboxyvinyltransferase [Lactobacillus acetotolerans]HBQ43518.1 UDP
MKQMIIHGGKPLQGDVWIGGAKNSAVALIPASILSRTPVTLEGVPRIADVDNLMDLLNEMDVESDFHETTLRINPEHIKMSPLPTGKIKSLRASYYFMGALLGRFGKAIVGFPGGDDIGPRPIDQHIKGFEALGACVKNKNDQIIITAPEDGLHGATIHLKMPSVGATMNIIMASVTAKGQTIIDDAAKEPEIIDLATFLNNMGATIRGAGTDSIRIEGVKELRAQAPHTIIPDRIEAGTYISLAACIGNGIRIHNIIEEHLDSYLAKVEEMGVVIDADEDSLYVYPAGALKMIQIKTAAYPGFATDLQQPITPLLLTAKKGEGVIIDQIYPKRTGHIAQLRKMGANIKVEDNIILVHPTKQLHGAVVSAGEIRAGACLMIAGLMAKGKTVINNADNILRGYDRVQEKLRQLGADVKIQDAPDNKDEEEKV